AVASVRVASATALAAPGVRNAGISKSCEASSEDCRSDSTSRRSGSSPAQTCATKARRAPSGCSHASLAIRLIRCHSSGVTSGPQLEDWRAGITLRAVASELTVQPALCQCPFALDGGGRLANRRRRFLNRQAAEKTKLDDPSLVGIEGFELLQSA